MIFTGIVAIICPVGLSQGQRQIFSSGLVKHGATLLDFHPRDRANASSINAAQLLMKAAKSKASAKRKRGEGASEGEEGGGSSARGKTMAYGPCPTHIICDEAAFKAGKLSPAVEGVFGKYPRVDSTSSMNVVGSAWLSECLRLSELQPLGPHLLDTSTLGSVESSARKSVDKGAAGPKPPSKSSWGCLAPTPPKQASNPSKKVAASAPNGVKSPWTASAKRAASDDTAKGPAEAPSEQRGVGAGQGGASGPGDLNPAPVWKDADPDDGGGHGPPGLGDRGAGPGRWEELEDGAVLRWVPAKERFSTHVAAFDMDNTLIKTKSGKRFGDHDGDWELWSGSIPKVMKAWYERGYKLAIITNQLGVGKGKVDQRKIQAKVEAVVAALKVPVEVYVACQDDYHRKPRPGCWQLMTVKNNGGLDVVNESCLYVGDAAGRPKQGTFKKDFSAADFKLALNVGVPFQTPEQFFMRSPQRLHKDRSLAELGFDTSTLSSSSGACRTLEGLSTGRSGGEGENVEVVVLVGPPAAGKSTLCEHWLPGHVRINQDELLSLDRCKKEARVQLKGGSSIVVDATNPKRATRSSWIALAREHGAKARCIVLETSKEACFHLNAFRGCNPYAPQKERRMVPDVAIHTWFKRVEQVDPQEDFSDVVRVPFMVRRFPEDASRERDLLFMHLLPK